MYLEQRIAVLEQKVDAIIGRTAIQPHVSSYFTLIEELVAREMTVDVDELRGRRRTDRIALARHMSYFVAKQVLHLSSTQIAAITGRDHGSILNGWHSVELRCSRSPTVVTLFETIKQKATDLIKSNETSDNAKS
jgi:chromosomal replication initiation ATPase DnaA